MATLYDISRNGRITVPTVRGSATVYRHSVATWTAHIGTTGTTEMPIFNLGEEGVVRRDITITREGRWYWARGEKYRTLWAAAAALLVSIAREADITVEWRMLDADLID